VTTTTGDAPRSRGPEVESSYHLADVDLEGTRCQGLACFAARHLDPERWNAATRAEPRVYCLGKCYGAPASARDEARPHIEVVAPEAIVLERVATGGATTLDRALARGAFAALEQALDRPPLEVVEELEASRLRGRGGAGFPAGRKWRAVHDEPVTPKYIVCNADEGDPGAYIDRFIMEDDPYCLVEAMAIAGYAVGAEHGIVYVRKEYPAAYEVMARAVAHARAAGLLGANVLERDFAFDVELVSGEGSYLCGEETALLNALEGRRPEPRARPPYPFRHGLWGRPTLVHNVETLASIPWIIRRGGAAYAAYGTGESRGTKVLSLNSLFSRPGLYEVELGTPLATIVHELGGGLRAGQLAGLVIGGPLAAAVPPERLDVPLTFEDLHAIGAALGHGGVVAFDEHTSARELVEHVFSFGCYESCGKCTPCRVGTAEIAAGSAGGRATINALRATSLCGHGAGLGEFADGMARLYPEELGSWLG
jgi:NADH:ubiquinone oxidoreductase subunit F (NADH-binding)